MMYNLIEESTKEHNTCKDIKLYIGLIQYFVDTYIKKIIDMCNDEIKELLPKIYHPSKCAKNENKGTSLNIDGERHSFAYKRTDCIIRCVWYAGEKPIIYTARFSNTEVIKYELQHQFINLDIDDSIICKWHIGETIPFSIISKVTDTYVQIKHNGGRYVVDGRDIASDKSECCFDTFFRFK